MTLVDAETGEIVDTDPLSVDEALVLTAKIKSYVSASWRLIAIAYKRRAHRSLGYTSWENYVDAEFGISRSRSYQLLDHAYVVEQIEAAALDVSWSASDFLLTGVSNALDIDLTARQVADIKPVIEEITEEISDALTQNPDADPQEVVDQAIGQALEAAHSAREADGSGALATQPDPAADSPSPEDADGSNPATEGGEADPAPQEPADDPSADPDDDDKPTAEEIAAGEALKYRDAWHRKVKAVLALDAGRYFDGASRDDVRAVVGEAKAIRSLLVSIEAQVQKR